MEQNELKIANPQRIIRILRRISQARLPVLIRFSTQESVLIRGRASELNADFATPKMRISNISEAGIKKLEDKKTIQIEFVMMSTKISFVSRICQFDQNSITVAIPDYLLSIERRKNARHITTKDFTSFVALNIWQPNMDDVSAPPTLLHFQELMNQISIVDIGMGGICGVTRFPSAGMVLKRGLIDDNAMILFPMQKPIKLGMEIRWIKKIKEQIKDVDGFTRNVRSFRFGGEFIFPNEDTKLAVRQYIQQLMQAEAI